VAVSCRLFRCGKAGLSLRMQFWWRKGHFFFNRKAERRERGSILYGNAIIYLFMRYFVREKRNGVLFSSAHTLPFLSFSFTLLPGYLFPPK
jgi:hypothetical protein